MRFPVLSVITWMPFIGALLIMFLARHRPLAVRLIALTTTSVSTVLSIWIYVAYEREAAGFQFYEKLSLVPPLGISYELGVDGMSLLMVLLTSVIIFAGVYTLALEDTSGTVDGALARLRANASVRFAEPIARPRVVER